jgi:hypothetical protein
MYTNPPRKKEQMSLPHGEDAYTIDMMFS